ncbi:MAG: BREX system Lon protease-like protein BrxL, partial [Promethearchaeia archaeon]
MDKKLLDLFPRKVVRKNYGNYISQFRKFPNFVYEFLISKYADADGSLSNEALNEIIDTLKKMSPDKREKEAIKSTIMDLGGIDLIDHYEVYTDLRNKKYYTYVYSLNEKALVNKSLVRPSRHRDLLKGGLWGRARIKYIEGEYARLNLVEFESFQTQGVILSKFIEIREEFSFEEWLDFIIRSIGLNPNYMNYEEKLLFIARLIPFVESGTNLLELGPPGTGKSFIYENSSTYCRMLLGGDISPARLIYNQVTRQNGLVFTKDVLCFDEINKSSPNLVSIIPKLQQIMASDKVERGDLEAKTEVSLVFQGNIDFELKDNKIVPKENNFLKILPDNMYDSAFLDRIHLFIYGWKIPRILEKHINYHLGLISNHLAEIFHKLRRENVSQLIDEKIEFYKLNLNNEQKPLSIRDKKALYIILSGFIKLLFPHKKIKDSEWRQLTELAIKLRQNVIDEIIKIDQTLYRKLNYNLIQSSQFEGYIVESQAQEVELEVEKEEIEIGDQFFQYQLDFNKIYTN